jgi:hypothetical protein
LHPSRCRCIGRLWPAPSPTWIHKPSSTPDPSIAVCAPTFVASKTLWSQPMAARLHRLP